MARRPGNFAHQAGPGKSEVWLTPPYIIEALGPFDLDPCAAPMPRPWDTAAEHYTWPQQDGLKLPWGDKRVWLNPPYGNAMVPWLRKLSAHGKGTSLIFARTETEAFFSYVWEEADAVMFLRGRLHFHYADGRQAKYNGGAPSVLIAYGREDAERLIESGLDGAIVGLKRPVMIHLALDRNVPMPGWKKVVLDAIRDLGGRAGLQQLYRALEDHPRAKANPHYREKIRQTIARAGLERDADGQYALAM
jgi:DNA N-6-adenine-methyltransferase (Dam).